MLNIVKLNFLKKKERSSIINEVKTSKHFPSSIREWNNSIYVYNKKALSLIPETTISSIKIIKSYFTLFNYNIEQRLRTERLLLRFRRLSSNKIYISNGEFKHTNNKVIINLYLFNRQKHNYILSIRKLYLKTIFKKEKNKKFNYNYTNIKDKSTPLSTRKNKFNNFYLKINKFKHKSQNIKVNFYNFKNKFKGIKYNKSTIKNSNKIKYNIFKKYFVKKTKLINKKGLLLLKLINRDKYLVIKALKNNKNTKIYSYISVYIIEFYKKFIKKSLKKLQLYFYYRQLVFINNSKYSYSYLQYLNKYLSLLYNKNIEYNLINLKRFYLHSDIISESITLKLTKNRRRILKYLNILKDKIKVKGKNKILLRKNLIDNKLNYKKNSASFLESNLINNLKYKDITGFRLQTKGRLTRRYTASRSVLKIKYKGNLLNLDSSYKGLSTILLKGNLKSNLQYTKLKSKSRIGSFGIKGWISGN